MCKPVQTAKHSMRNRDESHGVISRHSGAIRATARAAGDRCFSRLDPLATQRVNSLPFPAWSKGGWPYRVHRADEPVTDGEVVRWRSNNVWLGSDGRRGHSVLAVSTNLQRQVDT
jgi:hypothetical protein